MKAQYLTERSRLSEYAYMVGWSEVKPVLLSSIDGYLFTQSPKFRTFFLI